MRGSASVRTVYIYCTHSQSWCHPFPMCCVWWVAGERFCQCQNCVYCTHSQSWCHPFPMYCVWWVAGERVGQCQNCVYCTHSQSWCHPFPMYCVWWVAGERVGQCPNFLLRAGCYCLHQRSPSNQILCRSRCCFCMDHLRSSVKMIYTSTHYQL